MASPFNIGGSPDIICNIDALKMEYVPDDIMYREEKIEKLAKKVYNRVAKHGSGENVMVYGPAGSGKTVTLKWMNQQFREELEEQDEHGIKPVYVNCEGNPSPSKFFDALLDQFGLTYKQGMGIGSQVEKLYEHISDQELDIIIVIDELDSLKTDRREYVNNVLYRLLRPFELYSQWDGNITIIGVSNDISLKKTINDSVRSSFGHHKVMFNDYSRQEITDILMDRQDRAFHQSVIPEQAMNLVSAAIINDFGGDIRSGLRVLRDVAEELSACDDPNDIDQYEMQTIIKESIDNVKRDELENYLIEADDHMLLVMLAYVESAEDVDAADQDGPQFKPVNERYKKLCEYARIAKEGEDGERSDRYVRRKLDDMDENNILAKHTMHHKEGSPCEYEPIVSLSILEDVVEKQLSERGLDDWLREGAAIIMEKREGEIMDEIEGAFGAEPDIPGSGPEPPSSV